MIEFYSGTPGSGKSIHAAMDIIACAEKGKPVIGNFPCDLSKYPKANFTYVREDELTPEYLVNFSQSWFGGRKLSKRDENAILLVIDECQLMFNSRSWQQSDRKIWLSFFTLHRHYGFRIILIAQMDKMIDRQIRGVIEYEYVHRKLSNFGKAGKVLSFFSAGELFTAVQMWYPLKLKIGNKFLRAKKRYYSIYDSYATFDFGQGKPTPAELEAVPEAAAPAPAPPGVEMMIRKWSGAGLKVSLINGFIDYHNFMVLHFPAFFTSVFKWVDQISYKPKYIHPGGRSELGWK